MDFLAFDAERVDRVEQIDAQALGEYADQRQDLIEIRFHLESLGAVFESLRQFAVGNVAVRDEDERVEPAGARVGGHRRGRVAGRDAGHAFHTKPARLCHARRHAVVLERSGGIEALMLERDVLESAIGRGARRLQKRRVAFAQRDDIGVIVEKGKQFAIAPDAALLERGVRHPPFAPYALERRGVDTREVVLRFEKTAAFRTVVDDVVDRTHDKRR
jgi:hypothetical protein